ncbi:MMPL family transporter [Kribbella sp. NPDC050820]|uniref:MMPL family transporter n=1 Tax=Kribbella sp. NPDC050820 TaxID=3155408 RepID=UPI0033C1B61A
MSSDPSSSQSRPCWQTSCRSPPRSGRSPWRSKPGRRPTARTGRTRTNRGLGTRGSVHDPVRTVHRLRGLQLSRVKEADTAGLGHRDSIIEGLASSAKVITCAAAIMIAVAAGFAADPSIMVKIIGVGMAVAILVDVTLVRLLIGPRHTRDPRPPNLVPALGAAPSPAPPTTPNRRSRWGNRQPGTRPSSGPGATTAQVIV